jgi:hypothetical protein
MAHQRCDHLRNSTYLLRHYSWIYRYHRTSRSFSLRRSAGADTACIYRKGSSSRIGLTRDHYLLTQIFRRSHIPFFTCRPTGDGLVDCGEDGEPEGTVPLCVNTPMLSALIPQYTPPAALELYVYYGLFLACLFIAVVAFWHAHTRASRPGPGQRRFLYITIC